MKNKMTAATYSTIGQAQFLQLKQKSQPILTRSKLANLERLAKTEPWKKLKILMCNTSKSSNKTTITKPFDSPIFLMKLLVLQELFDVDVRKLRSYLGPQYSLFVFFIPGMEKGLPKQAEVDRLKRRMLEMNLLYAFLNESVETMGMNRSKIDLSAYYNNKEETQAALPTSSSTPLYTLACPQCGRKNLRVRSQTLIEKIFKPKKAYTCNSCTFHFEM